MAGQSVTARDQQVYQDVLSVVFQKETISKFSQKNLLDFILAHVSAKEAEVFDLQADKIKLSDAQKKKLSEYTTDEINREIQLISKASSIIELKENQLKQQDRFDTWAEILKRKYQVKLKVTEVK